MEGIKKTLNQRAFEACNAEEKYERCKRAYFKAVCGSLYEDKKKRDYSADSYYPRIVKIVEATSDVERAYICEGEGMDLLG